MCLQEKSRTADGGKRLFQENPFFACRTRRSRASSIALRDEGMQRTGEKRRLSEMQMAGNYFSSQTMLLLTLEADF